MATWVITGANRGLGLEFARHLHRRGEKVIATARAPEKADELNTFDVRVEKLDVRDPKSVNAFAERVGEESIDILLNNSAIGVKSKAFGDLDLESLKEFFDVNSIGPMRVTQALLPNIERGEKKQIVNVTSKMGSIADNGMGGAYAYRASKAALNALNKSLAIDYGPKGITSIVIHPGWVRTDMGGDRAPLSVEESITGMLGVIDGLTPAHNGKFLNYDGSDIPW